MTLLAQRRSGNKIRGEPREITFSDADFARVAAYCQTEFGLYQAPEKKALLHSRLQRLLPEIGCSDIPGLLARLEADPGCTERAALVSALTTNVTAFFREPHHFVQFRDSVLRPKLTALKRGGRLRVWSAGCSAGQEPCSVALSILELLPEAPQLNIRILATDIDTEILNRARQGIYPAEEAAGLPPGAMNAISMVPGAGSFEMPAKIRNMIRFAPLNLVDPWPMRGPFDAIFCRNVAIYFDKPTQARLWTRLAAMLAPGGLLFIGHSERVAGPASSRLTSAGITTYRLSTAAEGKSQWP